MTEPLHTPECFNNHLGIWLAHGAWMSQAVEAVKAGVFATRDVIEAARKSEEEKGYQIYGGVAVVNILGPIMKGFSKYGGTSSIATRRAIREAARDKQVAAIMLNIDSPGGHVAGTKELADEVRNAAAQKMTVAQISDLGASAAYWVASQSNFIFANETAEVGSIGTVAVVQDTSGAYEAAGVKVHVVSTGEYKGAFTPGTEVTDAMLADLRETVEGLNEIFLSAVASGRQMTADAVAAVADGRTFLAKKARSLGLIDAVQPFAVTIEQIRARVQSDTNKARAQDLSARLDSYDAQSREGEERTASTDGEG